MPVSVDSLIDNILTVLNSRALPAVLVGLLAALLVHTALPGSQLLPRLRWLSSVWDSSWLVYAEVGFVGVRIADIVFTRSRRRRRRRFQWSEQLAVVTGASSGLGAATAQALLSKGCRVACLDVRPCEWAETSSEYDDQIVKSWCCDVSRADEVNETAQAVRAHFNAGAPTILMSNAGIMVGKPLLSLGEGEFERTMAINCFATYYCLRAFLPGMLQVKDGAHVCVTASIMSYVGVSQLSDYVASKHALCGIIDSVRRELQQDSTNQDRAPLHWSMLVLGQMSTPLFARVRMTALGQFLMPVQEPAVVAQDVIRAIESRRQLTYIYRPYLARLAPIMQALPTWFRDAVQRISGADSSMQPSSSAGL